MGFGKYNSKKQTIIRDKKVPKKKADDTDSKLFETVVVDIVLAKGLCEAKLRMLVINGRRGELKNLRLLINNNLTIYSLRKRGSWQEKRGELLPKRARVLLAVLLLSTLPISIEELADTLGYQKKDSLREGYLNPLRYHKLIEHTIAQANSPNQQYRITQRGINFLMGSAI